MAKYLPNDPEMWLDLVPIPHRACAHFAADRQIPRGFSTMLPCSLLGLHRKPRRPGVPHGQWSGLPGPDESDHPCGDETAGGSILAG